jgi:hypothetical protein
MLTLLLLIPLLSSAAAQSGGFDLPPLQERLVISPYAFWGAEPRYVPFEELGENAAVTAVGRSVGQLGLTATDAQGTLYSERHCTANLIAADLILTNAHCVREEGVFSDPAALDVLSFFLIMGRTASDDGQVFVVFTEPLEIDARLDYAILRVAGAPGDRYGTVPLRFRDADPNEPFFIVHHPMRRPKLVTLQDCFSLDTTDAFARVNALAREADELERDPTVDGLHHCDIEHGSSGSLLFSQLDGALIGLNYAGTSNLPNPNDRFNFYAQFDALVRQSPILQSLTVAPTEPPTTEPPPVTEPPVTEPPTTEPTGSAYVWSDVRQLFDIQPDGTIIVTDDRTLSRAEPHEVAFLCFTTDPGIELTMLPGTGVLSPGPEIDAYSDPCLDDPEGTELVIENEGSVASRRYRFQYRIDGAFRRFADGAELEWNPVFGDADIRNYELIVVAPVPLADYEEIVVTTDVHQVINDRPEGGSIALARVPAGATIQLYMWFTLDTLSAF